MKSKRRRTTLLVGAVVATLALLPGSALALTPSPADWRDLVIYQVITDRFADGNVANNAADGPFTFDPADGVRSHGGDFAGIQAKLDYLVHLGVGAVWISPVVLNANGEYHGYAARDFFAIAPHFGTLAELRSMVDACHARGIYVILDVVVNHMGDLIDSGDPGYSAYRTPPATYNLRWRNVTKRHAGFFDDLTKFHAQGAIGSFSDPEQILGELSGLDDLKTEDAAVRNQLAVAAQWLVDSTDCDGFRLDMVKHIEMAFWSAWSPVVHAGAAAAGKSSFFLFGEIFDGSDAKNGSYTGTVGGGNYKLDSVLWFPMYFTTTGVFGFDDPPTAITSRWSALTNYDATSRERLVSFLDNHDVGRFLSFGIANQDESRLRAALGFHLTARGVPVIYYGTEQEFDGGGDPHNREDMWDGQWDFGPSDGDNFDLAHPLALYTRALAAARRRHDALRRGTTTALFAAAGAPGLLVYQRVAAGDTVVVAVNTSNAPQTRVQSVPWPAGTLLGDAIRPELADTVVSAFLLTLRVPARDVRIYESLSSRADDGALDRLEVEAIFPGHDLTVNDRVSPLTITFDRDVDEATLAAGFQISPATAGTWVVSGRKASFHHTAPWLSTSNYTWSLGPTVAGTDGRPLAATWAARFRTGPSSTGVNVTAGYMIDRIARQGLVAPEGLLATSPLQGPALLLTDTGRDRVFTITPGGDLGHWLGDSRWTKPEGIARSPAGRIAIADETGVYEPDARRMTASMSPASGASDTGAIAWGGPDFGDAIFLCDPANDRVARVMAGGALQTFASAIKGGEGLAFGPGGAWGTDLYVADADLTTLGTSADGDRRIVRVTPAGVASTFVADVSLLRGVSALAFDHTGKFGGHLFAADILADRVLQITAAGSITVLASAFKNLSGSHCIAFGPDGALYVADAGSGQSFSNSNGTNPPAVYRISRDDATVEVPVPVATGLALAAPWPNPTSGGASLGFTLPARMEVSLAIFDISGRRVRTLVEGGRDAGAHAARWDGRDEQGRSATAGLYFARLAVEGRTFTRRLVRLP